MSGPSRSKAASRVARWCGRSSTWKRLAGSMMIFSRGERSSSSSRAALAGESMGGRVGRASALVAKPRSSAAGTAGESHGTDKAPRDDLPRFFHQLVNNLAGWLDLADQAD